MKWRHAAIQLQLLVHLFMYANVSLFVGPPCA
jgi:hypothetical protein